MSNVLDLGLQEPDLGSRSGEEKEGEGEERKKIKEPGLGSPEPEVRTCSRFSWVLTGFVEELRSGFSFNKSKRGEEKKRGGKGKKKKKKEGGKRMKKVENQRANAR
ncbi:hypothetical protein SLEP1_g31643 [Rubroshorea leprosula]|uniref:Uncharacterized protein n=1 Tax=Rubroshorea leprosula TaxID=152421 RepID=A0AAV5KAZ3_9ROSI|nr:hypothetical protein SLEP1_g31643 [Rubroshorea leprosula]